MRFSSLVDIEPSATLAINSLAQQKKATGERVYNLSAGEPMLPTHPLVIETATKAMQQGKTLYPPVAGIPELRRAMVRWMNDTYRTAYTDKNILVTCGGKFGIYALCQAFLEKGDEAIMIAPYWVSYPSTVELFGGKPVMVSTDEKSGWKARAEEIEKVCTKRTKLLFLNNGGNPTGILYSRAELSALLAVAQRHDILVVSDEVYSGLTYDRNTFVSCGSFPEYQDNVVVIQSCSKHFAMTGWRVGFAFAPENIVETLTTIQSQSTTGTSSVSQWAALAAVENATTIIPEVNIAMQKRRDALVGFLQKYFPGPFVQPAAGLYVFVSLPSLGMNEIDSTDFCKRVLEEANVALVPGAPFGKEGYVRFSFGAEEKELEEAVAKLSQYLQK